MKLSFLSLLAVAAALPQPGSLDLSVRDNSQPENQPFQGGVFWQDSSKSVYAVSGKMQVPNLRWFSGGDPKQFVSAWVGIWGDDCGFDSALLQAGLEAQITEESQSWWPFLELYPAPPVVLNVKVNPGDDVTFQVVADSPTSGTATVTNLRTGQSDKRPVSGNRFCQSNAMWIVEDNAVGDNLPGTELADFGTITMTDALAISQDAYHKAEEGHLVNMVENGRKRVNVSKQGSQVTVQYAGR